MKDFLKQNAAYGIFMAFILFAPFLSGLFYKGTLYQSLVLLLVLSIFVLYRAKKICIDKKLIILFTVQLFFVGVSTLNGINKEEAIFGFFKFLFVPVIFFLSLNLENLKKVIGNMELSSRLPRYSYNRFIAILFTSGMLTSAVNISLSFHKPMNLKNYRADAVLGYANTLALFVFICSLCGLYLYYSEDRSRMLRVILKIGISLNITVLILTYSRTMWVLSFFLYACFLIKMRKPGSMVDAILLIAVSCISGIMISYGNRLLSLPVFLFFLTFLIYYEYSLRTKFLSLLEYNEVFKRKALAKTVFTALILVLIAAAAFLGSTYLSRRVSSIGFGATELQERFAYYKDTISIFKDYPLFGTGSGGWSSIQFKYQTALYSVQYVHSSVFQTLLDYGIMGLLLFIAQLAAFVLYSIRALKRNSDRKIRSTIILAVVCNSAILLHSMLDFDLEFSLITMIFWINIGFLSHASGNTRSLCNKKTDQWRRLCIVTKTVLLPLLCFTVLCLISFRISYFYYSKGIADYNSNQWIKAEMNMDQAIRFNPFSSNAYYAKAKVKIHEYKENQSAKVLGGIRNALSKAEKYDSFNPVYSETLADLYDDWNLFQLSKVEYGKLINLMPMRIQNYEGLSQSLIAAVEADLKSGRTADAKDKCYQTIGIIKYLDEASSRISPNAKKLKHKLVLKITPELAYNIGRAYLYLNDTAKAVEFFKIASEGKDIPQSWLLK